MALAVPADALAGTEPAEPELMLASADDAFEQSRSESWKAASGSVRSLNDAWESLRASDLPPRLEARMSRALQEFTRTVAERAPASAALAAVSVAQAGLDLALRYRPPSDIDRSRLEQWAR
jgi:hypothetical protein